MQEYQGVFQGFYRGSLLNLTSRNVIKLRALGYKGMAAIQAAFSKLGGAQYVDHILSCDTVTHKKPDPELYHAEIKPIYPDLRDKDILVVGDTRVDLAFAQNAGLQSCWASYGYGKNEECLAFTPTYTMKSAEELASIVVKYPYDDLNH